MAPPPSATARAYPSRAGIACTCAMLTLAAPAASVKLKWKPNPETNVIRYEIQCGTSPGSYFRTIDAGMNTRATVDGLAGGVTHRFTVTAVDSTGASSEPSDEIIYQTPASGDPAALVPRDGWSLLSTDSEETDGFAAGRAFDGDPATFWHTRWRSGDSAPPHEICIDLGTPHVVGGFRYLPRQDEWTVGNISSYGFFVSMDGTSWESPVATGKFTRTPEQKQVLFAPKYGRYVRLVGISEVNGYRDCNVAELSVLGFATCGGVPQALAFGVSTPAGTPMDVILQSRCPSYEPLKFRISSPPLHGCISGTPPRVVYLPEPGFSGNDSFTYQVNDGIASSNEAGVSVTVSAETVFTSWLASHGATGGLTGNMDADQIPNGIEFLLGTDPSEPTHPACLPTFQQSGTDSGQFIFTYRRADAFRSDPSLSHSVEWTTNPGGPWNSAADTPEIRSDSTDDVAAPGVDEVRVSIPRSLARNGSLFARLKISDRNTP